MPPLRGAAGVFALCLLAGACCEAAQVLPRLRKAGELDGDLTSSSRSHKGDAALMLALAQRPVAEAPSRSAGLYGDRFAIALLLLLYTLQACTIAPRMRSSLSVGATRMSPP